MPSLIGDGATALEVIHDAIGAGGLGYTSGTNLFMGLEPDGTLASATGTTIPDAAVFITEGDGIPDLTMGLPVAVERPTIQIMARGAKGDYLGPKQAAMLLRYFVASLENETRRGVTVTAAVPLGSVLPLGLDEAGRHRFTVNFNVAQEPTYVP
jgi:hypothetical protein